MKKPAKERGASSDPEFEGVAEAFAGDPRVTCGGGKGFGSGALKVNGKIFAMLSSKGEFVVKLPKHRVDELASNGQGERFDPGHGRLMKEWVIIPAGNAGWISLAQEACDFVMPGER